MSSPSLKLCRGRRCELVTSLVNPSIPPHVFYLASILQDPWPCSFSAPARTLDSIAQEIDKNDIGHHIDVDFARPVFPL